MRLHRIALTFAILVALLTRAAYAVDAVAVEEVKAAFLYNLCKYVEWPPDLFAGPAAPIRIAFVRNRDLAATFQRKIADRTAQGRGFEVTRFDRLPASVGRGDFHVVFFGSDSVEPSTSFAERLPSGVVTIGEAPRFADEGGILNLVVVDDQLKFEVNRRNAARSGVTISAKLLRLAWRVIEAAEAAS